MQLGTTKQDRIELPDAILESHAAILGKTGSGKTSTAKLLIEHVVNSGGRVCILDPIKSDWWGLTSSADGKKAGLPFHILGGPHGHVSLHESAGRAIGEVVANGALPLSIIDMADFKMGGLQTFFCDFAEALLKKNRGHVYLVLEEAHEFAPKELAGVKGENMGVYWSKKLATAGRSKGLRMVLVTQRTQALHNALLGSCETMVVHRMTAPADQTPATNWLKANAPKAIAKEISESLSSLKTGEAWLCSGEAQLFERIHFPRIGTYDNTSGHAHRRAIKTSPVDAEKLRSIVGEAIEEAKANDPKELKKKLADKDREIAALKRDAAKPAVAAKPVAQAIDAKKIKQVEFEATRARDRQWAQWLRPLFKQIDRHKDTMAKFRGLFEQLPQIEYEPSGLPSPETPPAASDVHNPGHNSHPVLSLPAVSKAVKQVVASRNGDASGENSGELPEGEQAVLTALIQCGTCDNAQLVALTGRKTRTVQNILVALRGRGYVEPGRPFKASPAGITALGDVEPLPTGEALQAYWLGRLPAGEAKVLQQLIAIYPESSATGELSEVTGNAPRTVQNILVALSARKLITRQSGRVHASLALFNLFD